MTANKMPEAALPEGAVMLDDAGFPTNYAHADFYTADQMRAMYLAGIAAARAAVESCPKDDDGWVYPQHVFDNLSALEQEAQR